VPEQLPSLMHWTQVFVEVLQAGVAPPPQWSSLVHGTQVFVEVLQAGVAPPQLPSAVHSTHVFAVSLHTGLVPLQTGLHADVLPPVPLLPPVMLPLPPLLPASLFDGVPPESLAAPHVAFRVQSSAMWEHAKFAVAKSQSETTPILLEDRFAIRPLLPSTMCPLA
jgi:hypothetical protein